MKKSGTIFTAPKQKVPKFLSLVTLLLVCLFVGLGVQQFVVPTTSKAAADSVQNQNVVTIPIQNMQFNPPQITVQPGTTVMWINRDSIAHTVTSDNGLWDSGVLQPGQSISMTFSSAGTYNYHCNIHPSMRGSILVGSTTTAPAPQQPSYQHPVYQHPYQTMQPYNNRPVYSYPMHYSYPPMRYQYVPVQYYPSYTPTYYYSPSAGTNTYVVPVQVQQYQNQYQNAAINTSSYGTYTVQQNQQQYQHVGCN